MDTSQLVEDITMKRTILKWELIGIIVISLLGSVLHFLFELSGEWLPVGVIAAVNESVFEHLKLTFWPTILYGVVTYRILKNYTGNFIVAKAAAVYIMPLTIIVLFYAYTTLTGWESLAIDITIFILAIVAGQLASYKILSLKNLPRWLKWLSLAFLVILAVIYGLFTFYPPHVDFFMDSATGTYGIP
jgi:hypothetical protein